MTHDQYLLCENFTGNDGHYNMIFFNIPKQCRNSENSFQCGQYWTYLSPDYEYFLTSYNVNCLKLTLGLDDHHARGEDNSNLLVKMSTYLSIWILSTIGIAHCTTLACMPPKIYENVTFQSN